MIISVASRIGACGTTGPTFSTLRRNLTVLPARRSANGCCGAPWPPTCATSSEVLALPAWSGERHPQPGHDDQRVSRAARRYAGAGAVVALPHSGNWDLAGAWACLTGMPVTTVAEQLAGSRFRRIRRLPGAAGIEVLSHRDPTAIVRAGLGRPAAPAGLPAG